MNRANQCSLRGFTHCFLILQENLEEMRWKELEKTRERAARLHAESAGKTSSGKTDLVLG